MASFRKLVMGAAFAAAAALTGMSSADAQDRYNWSGLYAGVNAGWIGKDFDWAFNPAIPGAVHQAYSLSDDGGVVGGHVGFQHQLNSLVLGVEAAFSGTNAFDNSWARESRFGNNAAFDSLARINNILTVGPRIGWAPSSQWLLFAGGGFASASVRTAAVSVANGNYSFETTERHNGWYVGGGVEFAITRNFILGVEYQHLDFGKELHCPGNACLGAAGSYVDRDIDVTADIVRARLSFKLGRPEEVYESMK